MKNKGIDKGPGFFKVWNFLMDKGIIARMQLRHIKVYLAIARYRNNETGYSYPSVETISNLSGINKNLIARATEELCRATLIEKVRTGANFNFRNSYRICEENKVDLDQVFSVFPKSERGRKSKDESGKFKSNI